MLQHQRNAAFGGFMWQPLCLKYEPVLTYFKQLGEVHNHGKDDCFESSAWCSRARAFREASLSETRPAAELPGASLRHPPRNFRIL